jgi:pimeloyl-ACP methyl ester carboxylesterase
MFQPWYTNMPRRLPIRIRRLRPFHRTNSACRLGVEPLERRDLLSGVTLITHGFNSDADGWVTAMAQAIADRPDLTIDQAIYRWDVTDPGHDNGPLSVTSVKLSGPSLTDAATDVPEVAVLLNWSDLAGKIFGGYTRSTGDVAAAVAEQLVSADFLAELGEPLASLPLHLIGHSRGGSLVGALANQLGQRGVWVDQVTTLDPHPVDGIDDPFSLDFGDAPMVAWGNVVYWDNYWRANSDLFDFKGESIANVHDVNLSDSVLAVGGYSYEHSDVHLWYYGTIDTSEDPPANNGDADVPNDWYGGENPERLTSGYASSRLVGGSRATDGLTAQFADGSANRDSVIVTQPAWPNVLDLQVTGAGTTFIDGASIPLDYYQADADSTATITFALDVDKNPFNANERSVLQRGVAPAATLQSDSVSLPTLNAPTGAYYVLATITDATGRTRYTYAPQIVIVENPSVNLPPTDILLDTTSVLENVTGYHVGHLTVVDPNAGDTHTFTVSDDRFEVVDATLKLKSDQSLNVAAETHVDLDLTAIDAGRLALDPPKHFVITVTANPFPWRNLVERLDVNADDYVSPSDALRIINELNNRKLTDSRGALPATRPAAVAIYYDVHADGYVSPIDALLIINFLTQQAEGESWREASPSAAVTPQIDAWPRRGSQADTPTGARPRHAAAWTDLDVVWCPDAFLRLPELDVVTIRGLSDFPGEVDFADFWDLLQSVEAGLGSDLEETFDVLASHFVRCHAG